MTLNNHHQGVTPHDFHANPQLPRAFEVLATNLDRKGREFVSVVEGKGGLPVWATQWHPEKNIFEQTRDLPDAGWWPYEAIAHTRAAVAVTQYLANFFVDQVRAAAIAAPQRRYGSAQAEWEALVYKQTTTTSLAPNFAQIYTLKSAVPDGLGRAAAEGDS